MSLNAYETIYGCFFYSDTHLLNQSQLDMNSSV